MEKELKQILVAFALKVSNQLTLFVIAVCDKLKEGLRTKRSAEGVTPVSKPERAGLKEFRHLVCMSFVYS